MERLHVIMKRLLKTLLSNFLSSLKFRLKNLPDLFQAPLKNVYFIFNRKILPYFS